MKLIKKAKSGNYIVTIAIGDKYFNDWEKFALPGWKKYCDRHKLGLIVFEEDLNATKDEYWKKATWQKFLIGSVLKKTKIFIKNVCYLDTDIIINYIGAPNIFDNYIEKTFGLVSLINNLPLPRDFALRSIAFNRNNFYSKKYPLDSALFMTPEKTFEFHNLKKFNDFACAGLFIFNLKNHSKMMEKWYRNYKSNYATLTAGDQPILNYEIQKYGKITWLDYKFQALWFYEMAWKYPFLYDRKNSSKKDQVKCIEATLLGNYFLHFPGSWDEGKMWLNKDILSDKKTILYFQKFYRYLNKKVYGLPKGMIKP